MNGPTQKDDRTQPTAPAPAGRTAEMPTVDLRAMDPEHRLAVFRRQLGSPPDREIQYQENNLIPTVGLFGTAGESQWRQQLKEEYQRVLLSLSAQDQEILRRTGVDATNIDSIVFDPQHGIGDREQSNLLQETTHLASDAVVVFGLTHEYSSVGSMAELGFVAALSFLKSKKTVAFIEPLDSSYDVDIMRVRSQAAADARYIKSMIPRLFLFRENLEEVTQASITQAAEFIEFLASPVREDVTKRFLPRNDIQNRMVLSGTSKGGSTELQESILTEIKQRGIPVVSTLRDDWNLGIYEGEEVPLKDTSLVNTVVVSDPTSFGAVKDVGLSVFRAIANGTYALVHIPEYPEAEDYTRARDLVLSHWNSIAEEFPWVTHYVHFLDDPNLIPEYAEEILNSKA